MCNVTIHKHLLVLTTPKLLLDDFVVRGIKPSSELVYKSPRPGVLYIKRLLSCSDGNVELLSPVVTLYYDVYIHIIYFGRSLMC